MSNWKKILLAATVLTFTATAQSEPLLTSREYKVLLNPANFAVQPDTAVNTFLKALKDELTATGFDKKIKGSFDLDKNRVVYFYDAPGSCVLKQSGYALRERTRLDTGKREIMLKLRATDLAQVGGVDLQGAGDDAQSKLEADITPSSGVYSYSTKQTIDKNMVIDHMSHIQALYPAWISPSTFDAVIVPVGNLDIQERTYDGPTADIGKQVAEFAFTLWYTADSTTPVNAEVSFVVSDTEGAFTAPVISRSEQMMSAIQGMSSWVARDSITKIAWVYQYQKDFCNQ